MADALKNVKDSGFDGLVIYISKIIATESGNILGENQREMVKSRLRKRLIDIGGLNVAEYYHHLESNKEREISFLVSTLTTHHTFFFREFIHFEYIVKNLDEIVERVKKRGGKVIKIYCAACSRGQEVYSLAMLFYKHLSDSYPGMSFNIIGTDIDPECVEYSKNGVYPFSDVKKVPQVYLANHWQRGSGSISHYAKVKKELKEHCSFEVLNLLTMDSFLNQKFDIVFCRNVFIYFDIPTIEKVCKNFEKIISPGGLLFTGVSESLKSMKIDVSAVGACIYQYGVPCKVTSEPIEKAKVAIKPKVEVVVEGPKPIRVLCVDDSSSILKLLTRIFESDPGFEVVGTAKDGIEAHEFLKNHSIDVMTLDIHMPNMNGVEYLEKYFGTNHPKVIIVSSASREDSRYAQKAIEFGASDFVEKPALNNLMERADEIKVKMKTLLASDLKGGKSELDVKFANKFTIENTDSKGRVFFLNFSDSEKIKKILGEIEVKATPTFLLFEGNLEFLENIKEELCCSNSKLNYEFVSGETKFLENTVYICDLAKDGDKVFDFLNTSERVSIGVLGECSTKVVHLVLEMGSHCQILIEDRVGQNIVLKDTISDVFPTTSFEHVGTEFLSKKKEYGA
ncbi:MAG: response regulator [Bacteriovoracaceae bacterium]|jgi:chemotaxis protein methyltransferase CheR|nr:response regulator [Bacteriovoracaceae bacterium]